MNGKLQKNDPAVNQLGYRSMDKKVAVIPGASGSFSLVDDTEGAVVWTGVTGPSAADAASGMTVCQGDFSTWRKPGIYRIQAEDGRRSVPFHISDQVYDEAQQALLKAFYYFRCGMKLEERFAGPWKHEACHLTPAIVHDEPERTVDACGGWHDAGDYGKYVGPGAKAIADLLLAYECHPQAFDRPLPLPESDGRIPDVLHECRYELEWLLRMQDLGSGGLFHKLTTLRFPPIDTMPEDDLDDLYVSPISAAATGCFAAVMAMAARVYAPFDASFADRCLEGAVSAWEWLVRNPDAVGFHNPPDIVTGEYGDEQVADERYWAAAELFRTTGLERYHQAFLELARLDSFDKVELGWADMGGYGTIAYLFSEQERELDSAVAAKLKEGWLHRASELAAVADQDGYGISLRPDQYIWGSNMLILNQAMQLLLADRLSGAAENEGRVLQHVHYLLGANPMGMSYVTGLGSRPVLHPHHRPSEGDSVEAPVPGLVSGGPNSGLHDDYARKHLKGKAPALAFADHVDSYSTNEVTIYWNSPAVFVLSHFTSSAESM